MKQAMEVVFEEACSADAQSFLDFFHRAKDESDFVILDETILSAELDVLAKSIQEQYTTENGFCLLAKLGETVVGMINITRDRQQQVDHIGDVFLVVLKDYWGQGLGSILLEEGIGWASYSGFIRRLELSVQVRNQRAVHLYQKQGFSIEGTKKRGAKTKDGEFLDVYFMSRLIDERIE